MSFFYKRIYPLIGLLPCANELHDHPVLTLPPYRPTQTPAHDLLSYMPKAYSSSNSFPFVHSYAGLAGYDVNSFHI